MFGITRFEINPREETNRTCRASSCIASLPGETNRRVVFEFDGVAVLRLQRPEEVLAGVAAGQRVFVVVFQRGHDGRDARIDMRFEQLDILAEILVFQLLYFAFERRVDADVLE